MIITGLETLLNITHGTFNRHEVYGSHQCVKAVVFGKDLAAGETVSLTVAASVDKQSHQQESP